MVALVWRRKGMVRCALIRIEFLPLVPFLFFAPLSASTGMGPMTSSSSSCCSSALIFRLRSSAEVDIVYMCRSQTSLVPSRTQLALCARCERARGTGYGLVSSQPYPARSLRGGTRLGTRLFPDLAVPSLVPRPEDETTDC